MSCVEIYTIRKKDGRLVLYDEVPRAMSGALYIWQTLEEKYLPSLSTDGFWDACKHGYKSRLCLHPELEHEIWELDKDPRLTWKERIVLESTYDYAIVRNEDLPELADAYETVPFSNDNMKKQAEVFRRIHGDNDKGIAGMWKLETSVCSVYDIAQEKRSRYNYCYITGDFYDMMHYMNDLVKKGKIPK